MIVEHDEDGRIFHVMHQPIPEGTADRMRAAGRRFVEGLPMPVTTEALFSSFYVADGVIGHRPAMEVSVDRYNIAADDTEVCTVTGLPVPCTVVVDGVEFAVDDGTVEFTTLAPGEHAIVVRAWPFVDFGFVVTAQ